MSERKLEPAFGEMPWMRGDYEEKDVFHPQPFGVMDDGTRMIPVDSLDEIKALVQQFRDEALGYSKVSAAISNHCASRLQTAIDKALA